MTAPGSVLPDGRHGAEVELFSLAGHEGRLCEVNGAFATLLGLDVGQVDGRSLLDLVHPEDLPAVNAGFARMAKGAAEALFESRFVQAGGGTVCLQWVARTLPGTDLWWAAGRDVTEFRRLLDRQRDLAARLDLAVGSGGAAMWELDLGTGRLSFEPQAVALLGVAADELPDSAAALAALVHADDAPSVLVALDQLAHGAVPAEVVVAVGTDPGTRWLSLRGRQLGVGPDERAHRAVGLLLDVTAAKAMEEQLLRMVMSDALTGVPNRRAFDQTLRAEWRRCTRGEEPLSVLMIDIDDFKWFNDTFGHLVGDAALCAVARSLVAALHRAGDTVARFGGEEFAVVLPGVDADGARTVAASLLQAVRGVQVRQAPGTGLSVSIGVASWTVGGSGKAADLLARADQALYLAKRLGKDQAAHLEPDPV